MTPRQQQILQLIEKFMRETGRPPTRADLAAALGLRNRQGIDQHLRALATQQQIALEPGVARGIRLLQSAGAAYGQHPGFDTRLDTLRSPRAAPRLPLYGRVAAGVPTLASSNIEDELALDPALFKPRADFLLRVHGESMREADILHRDILAVHRTSEARNGQIVVARLGDEATVKYYRRRAQLVTLEPANPEFQPILIDLRERSCTIEGVIVGLIRGDFPLARR